MAGDVYRHIDREGFDLYISSLHRNRTPRDQYQHRLALDRIFNFRVRASDLKHGTGTYRVYAALRDPDGDVLRTETVSGGTAGSAELKAWWQFNKT